LVDQHRDRAAVIDQVHLGGPVPGQPDQLGHVTAALVADAVLGGGLVVRRPVLRLVELYQLGRGPVPVPEHLPAAPTDAQPGVAGLGTWTARPDPSKRKSSTSRPSASTAWARTPAPARTRSWKPTVGTSRRSASQNARRLSDRWNSATPVRQNREAIL